MVGLMEYAENGTVEIMATNLRKVCISLNLTKIIKEVYRLGLCKD